jgi:hypothetical protein
LPKGYVGRWCRHCNRPEVEVGHISARGRCAECGDRRLIENHTAMLTARGPFFDHWRRRTLAAFGIRLVDDRRDEA